MAQQEAAQAAQALFPPPPPFYALYRPGADGSADHPLPPLPPPPPTGGEYSTFAMLHSVRLADGINALPMVESGLPRLQGRQIYTSERDGSIPDPRGQLLVLHKELVANVLELLSLLVEKPSAYARQVENVMTVFRNMMHLINSLRPHQARASLLASLHRDLAARREATKELRALSTEAEAALGRAVARLQEAAAAAGAAEADGNVLMAAADGAG